jgi:hypothetical protein
MFKKGDISLGYAHYALKFMQEQQFWGAANLI